MPLEERHGRTDSYNGGVLLHAKFFNTRQRRLSSTNLWRPIKRVVLPSFGMWRMLVRPRAAGCVVKRLATTLPSPAWRRPQRWHSALDGFAKSLVPTVTRLPAAVSLLKAAVGVRCEADSTWLGYTCSVIVVMIVWSGSKAAQHAANFRHHALSKKKMAAQPFNWALLWEMLKPDMYLLGAAVVAAVAVAVINVQIPTVLGEVRKGDGCSRCIHRVEVRKGDGCSTCIHRATGCGCSDLVLYSWSTS